MSHSIPYCFDENCNVCAKGMEIVYTVLKAAETAFIFWSSHGVPQDKIKELLSNRCTNKDVLEDVYFFFDALVEAHREKSRKASKFREAIF